MDHDRTQKNLTRLYPRLTVEEKDELLQSIIKLPYGTPQQYLTSSKPMLPPKISSS